jgi:hypothetical protein
MPIISMFYGIIIRVSGQARNNFYEINKINWLQDKHDVTL